MLLHQASPNDGVAMMLVRPPKFRPPQAGIAIERSFNITLDVTPSGDCLSLVQGRATILISQRLIEQLIAATPEKWTTEQERMALIHGNRAKELLQSLTPSVEENGCTQTPLSGESRYLVSDLLQSGQVAVVDNQTHQLVRQIVVTFHGVRAGPLAGMGFMWFSFANPSVPFFEADWWVS